MNQINLFVGLMFFIFATSIYCFIVWIIKTRTAGRFYTPEQWQKMGNRLDDNDLVWIFHKDGLVTPDTYRNAREKRRKCYVARPGSGAPEGIR